jgi:DNA ligase-associated metallophosphoesterase
VWGLRHLAARLFSLSAFLKYQYATAASPRPSVVSTLAKHLCLTHEQMMNSCIFEFAGTQLEALKSGALWWPECATLCVSDLHLGKSERIARKGGATLPPYETRDTLTRLAGDITATGARRVICLGDSFDDLGAAMALEEQDRQWILKLQAGRQWIWIEGNHDPGPTDLGGSHLFELLDAPLTFRHIAQQAAVSGEVSGHFHPKASITAKGRKITRPAFLIDAKRIVMPAYGTYTGGLDCRSPVLSNLMRADALAVLTGKSAVTIPMPRCATNEP